MAVAGSAVEVLGQVVAGMAGGADMRAFHAGIEAGQRMLGNRVFVTWVRELQSRGQKAPAQGTAVPLQMMPKKKKDQGEREVEAGSGEQAEDAEEEAGAKKKKKKSRVQVALNTLRGEGVEAFRGYIGAEIGEPELLRTLVQRIMRAEDLGGVREAALKVTRERAGVLDPEAGPVMRQAVAAGHGQVMEQAVLAQMKPDPNWKERSLIACCAEGDTWALRRLLRYGKLDINMGSRWGTPLCFAAYHGQAAIVRDLLSRPGIDINLAHDDGSTPLYLAAQQGNVEVVKLLLGARGIKVNLATKRGAAPLSIAAEVGNVEIMKLLLAAPGINVNPATSDEGTTPLLFAAFDGHEDIVRLLLDCPDIHVDAHRHTGTTPLYLAAQNNHPRVVEQLVKRGANVNHVANDRSTPLCAAAENGHVEVVRVLLRAPSIDVNQSARDEASPLAFAAQGGYKDIIRLLLRKGADPNKPHRTGLTPLHLAALHGHTAVAEMLLRSGSAAGARLVAAKPGNYTPYGLAELAGQREVMSVLAARRWRREDEPGSTASTAAAPEVVSLPVASVTTRLEQTCLTSPDQAVSQVRPEMESPRQAMASLSPQSPTPVRTAEAGPDALESSPLVQAKDALRQEVLGKLRDDNLESLEGIRLLEDVNDSTDLDGLCALYNRLAHIERHKERARRSKRRRGLLSVPAGPGPAAADPAAAPVFALGGKTGLDAERVEVEIKRHLGQAYHRFVSQAVNDMEFGRGKGTMGYPGLWHVSAGIPGVGSCSVFYYLEGSGEKIRVVGIGHHVGRAAYRLDYAAEELGKVGSILRIN